MFLHRQFLSKSCCPALVHTCIQMSSSCSLLSSPASSRCWYFALLCFAARLTSASSVLSPAAHPLIQDVVTISVTGSHVVSELPNLWSSTGFSPPDPHEHIPRLLSSNDMRQNMALIGSLPCFPGRREVRVDWLLDLVSIRQQQDNFVDYRFDHLDDFIQMLHESNLKPGFKLMGNPSKFFRNFEDETQLIIWWDMVKSIATRYVARYGYEYVREWNFETWKNPDQWDFDGINMTTDGFRNYLESSYQGLLSASLSLSNNQTTRTNHRKRDLSTPHFRFGGNGGKCVHMSNGSLCAILVDRLVDKLKESDATDRLNVFFSFEENGQKRSSENITSIIDRELQVLADLRSRANGLQAEIEVTNAAADSEADWSHPRLWHADATYAAFIARSAAMHIETHLFSNANATSNSDSFGPRLRFSGLGYENGYLSHFPHQFTQRTLLARFQVNNTIPSFVQFVKKPIFMAYGLMGLLGDQLLKHNIASAKDSDIMAIASSSDGNLFDQKSYSILVVNSCDQPIEQSNGSTRVNLTLTFTLTDLNFEWKYSRYTVDNKRTNPYKVWKDQGSRPFFTHRLLKSMRMASEIATDVTAQDLTAILSPDGFDHQFKLSFDLSLPAVSLILICSKAETEPEKVEICVPLP